MDTVESLDDAIEEVTDIRRNLYKNMFKQEALVSNSGGASSADEDIETWLF